MQNSVLEPLKYLEDLYLKFIHDLDSKEIKRTNYIVFSEVVCAFTACGVYRDKDEYTKAIFMQEKLKRFLDL
ncbi:hypothetical protein [Acinetobacter sp. SH20PTE14]|uniref:hypothetical protein n=1 Tax=Acinetobacter sp. SH20PTE14 TaxID=2905879 RepID=UPI001F3571AF|nr:hypothetical protein [Acinetobacter sp. SH20PTE14]UIJ74335.1 hypothetical protein LXF01_08660 [Acinetobacter sp. SH20PTE14]UIJ74342.1 hypothetical protein LXF01_08700 [Acinetobacter sp. SH20PTE14]